jgi:uncharacterized protein
MSKFEIFTGVNIQYYFRFKASNGEQLLSSEGYTTKDNCKNGIAAVKRRSPYDSAYIRLDQVFNYRYNMTAENAEIIARSSEGYTTKQNREIAIEIVKRDAKDAPVYDLT